MIRGTEENYEKVSDECQRLHCRESFYSFSPVLHCWLPPTANMVSILPWLFSSACVHFLPYLTFYITRREDGEWIWPSWIKRGLWRKMRDMKRSNLGGNVPSNNIRNGLKLYIIGQGRISGFQATERKLPTFSTVNTLSYDRGVNIWASEILFEAFKIPRCFCLQFSFSLVMLDHNQSLHKENKINATIR